MRIAVIQSCYLPWRGYFDFINSVDLFVIYDDVQYSTGSWRNRNRLKTRNGLQWITVPVRARLGQRIDEVQIGEVSGGRWQDRHRRQLYDALHTAPHYADAVDIWEACVALPHSRLTELNLELIVAICRYLAIDVPIVRSSDYAPRGSSTERLVNLLVGLGATSYLSGPTAKSYLEPWRFRAAGIRLEYKSYDYPPYPQLWGPFEGAVTVLDLIANCGRRAKDYLTSSTPNEVAVQ